MSRTITPAQQGYIRTLNAQLRELGTDWFLVVANDISITEASSAIEELKAMVAQARSPRKPELVAEGIYRRSSDGAMFRVQTSEEGRRYAKLLLPAGGWGYERGAIYTLKADERLSLTELEAWGISTGVCAICGRLLSTSESVARGIGPICAGRY
jgi:hypothetical protein